MTKAELHDLVDALPEDSFEAVAVLLRRAQDPRIAELDAAPYDDEEFSEEDQLAVTEGPSEPAVPWSGARQEPPAE